MVEERYKISAPAITTFFRQRLIVTEQRPEGYIGYHMEQRKRVPLNVYFNQLSNENLDVAKIVK